MSLVCSLQVTWMTWCKVVINCFKSRFHVPRHRVTWQHTAGTCQNEPESECAVACPSEPGFTLDDITALEPGAASAPAGRRLLTSEAAASADMRRALAAVGRSLPHGHALDALRLGGVDVAASRGDAAIDFGASALNGRGRNETSSSHL